MHLISESVTVVLASHLGGPADWDPARAEEWLTAWGAERTKDEVRQALTDIAEIYRRDPAGRP